jgi:hypothetical protein
VASPRVLFIHGLESGPQGTKAQLLGEHFEALTPAMETSRFEACVRQQAEAIRRFRPDLVIGSSFGGGVAVALLQRGLWRGPTLLLAAAVREQGLPSRLPEGVRVWLVHGRRDDLVPLASSRGLARSGTPALVRLIEVDDDHRLSASLADGRLLGWVRELAAAAPPAPLPGRFERHFSVFFEEPTLWPVLATAAAIFVSIFAAALLFGLRSRNPAVLLVLAVLIVASAEAVRRDWHGVRPGRVGGAILALWTLSAALAVVAGRLGVL